MSGRLALLAAGAAGFIALSYEILWYRAFSFVSGAIPQVFGLLLGFYLLGIAAGSIWARRICRDTQTGSVENLATVGFLVLVANTVSFLVVPGLALFATIDSWWYPAFSVVVIGAGLMGATLPLLAHIAIPPDDKSGARLSYLYLANIIGSALGSLATGFVLLDAFTLSQCGQILLAVGTLIGIAMSIPGMRAGMRRTRLVVAPAVALSLVLASPVLHDQLWERLMFKGRWDPEAPFAHALENRHGVICITPEGVVYGGGMYDGNINVSIMTDSNGIYRPWSLLGTDRTIKRVLMVGLAMGSWAQAVAHFPDLEELIVIEINPGYLELIPDYPAVASLINNPKVRVEIDDGRRWINRHPDARFDAIVQNTTYHWRAHMTNLLSAEYLELCRSRLNEGGVMLYNTTGSRHAMLTGLTVFPEGLRVFNNMMVSNAPLNFDADRWRERLLAVELDDRPMIDLRNPAHRAELRGLMEFATSADRPWEKHAMEHGRDLRPRLEKLGAEVITDDNMLCEWR